MIKTIWVMLIPNNKQKTKFFQYADTARFAYNWTLEKEQENYKNSEKFLSDSDLQREFMQLKRTKEYVWLKKVSNYEKNKEGENYCKTGNIIKREKELLRLNHRLTNIHQNY